MARTTPSPLYPRVRIATLACAGVALVLVAAPAARGETQPAEEQVKFAVNVEMVKGHLLASQALYAMGHKGPASAHAGHPLEELWSMLRGPLDRAGGELASRIGTLLEKPVQEIQAGVPREQYRATVRSISSALDEAAARVVPADVRSSLIFRARVLGGLLEHVEEEYAEAVKGGRVVETIEYQDAYGFFQRARALYRPVAEQLRKAAPEAAGEIGVAMAKLAKGFAGVIPPKSPLAVDTVEAEIGEITAELGKAAGVRVAAETDAVEEIGRVRSGIEQALEAYRSGQAGQAGELVTAAYLDHFEKVEGPLARRDESLMHQLEQLIRIDLREKIKAKAPAADVEQLARAILSSLDRAERLLKGQ